MVRLSVLDQSPVPSGSTPAAALRETVALARAAEALGYTRYWLAEHHGSRGLAGTAPEVLAAAVAAATSTIRVGAGGVLLSHYSPLKVAEAFRVLAGLFPGRIDLGLGRADGATAAVASALRAGVVGASDPFGPKLSDLLGHLDRLDHLDHLEGPGGAGPAMPEGVDGPEVWLLASSSDGALAAARLGLPLCFAHFISTGFGPQVVAGYRRAARSAPAPAPKVAVAVAVMCAATDAEAERLAASADVWRLEPQDARGPLPSVGQARARPLTGLEQARITQNRAGVFVGAPDRVAGALNRLVLDFEAEELVVLTVCHDPQARRRSYELLAQCFELAPVTR